MGEMCGLQTGPGEYCDDERMAFQQRCAFHALDAARTRIAELESEVELLQRRALVAEQQRNALHDATETAHEALADALGVAYGS